MEFTGSQGLWTALAIILVVVIAVQLAFEGLVLGVGAFIVWALSGGRIKSGERRHLSKPPPKLSGGAVFYYENSGCYMYQNFVGLVGLLAVLLSLTAIFGIGMWVYAH